ncbi:hypothetical protein SAMN06297129_3034 [Pseudooceanicola antarcticus]|uniref:Uncharacterized protein n=1 Tax=Pseudooceanicola antarcticus TaxID=1247613 RepID=A0A285J5F0_9RHOB|nr:hypothetical protein [Pseudooceanicola antarcticus]PJE26859.1 hypothetical protein CVM39_16110 [Pseudooceanicola antarcticus]SNY55545.1 hypothetical protein SAMN06297129_3034 [Pseudooceanicola antarcticus]
MRKAKATRNRTVTLDMLNAAVDEAMQQLSEAPAQTSGSARSARRVLDQSGVYSLRQALARRGGIARLPQHMVDAQAETVASACAA